MNYKDIQTIDDLNNIYPKHILDKFPIIDRGHFAGVSDAEWYSWKWQLKNRVTDLSTLEQIVNLTETERNAFEASSKKFKMAITPYYATLMNKNDPNCPIRKQSIPDHGELNILDTDMEDPLAEERDMPVPGLTHRYPDRALFYVSHDCPMLCRHCTRKRKVARPNTEAQGKQLEDGLQYIRETKAIRDVIVSGGDPLCLDNQKIDYILGELRKIEHVEVLRLGSRNPVTLPIRLRDDRLLEIIEKHGPIHLNTHYNHPREMTREALLANTRLHLAGATLANQAVLLKGVNDDPQTMTSLCHKLLLMKIRPYYIFQCDLSEGISHFRTTMDKGIEIIEKMRGWTSGLAIPQYVIDAPGGGGKVPINPQYFIKKEGNKITLRNYRHQTYEYFETT